MQQDEGTSQTEGALDQHWRNDKKNYSEISMKSIEHFLENVLGL